VKIPVVESVLKVNDQIAAENRQDLSRVFTLNLMGSPGCGKTALVEATLRALGGEIRLGVLVGDLTTTRDAERMARWCDRVVQINTGQGCHLEARHVREAIGRIDIGAVDALIIENVGNLICPVGYDLGETGRVGMFSVSEGDDKAIKHPHLVRAANLLVLNKVDLLPHVPFDLDRFRDDVHRVAPETRLLEVTATDPGGEGWQDWISFIRAGAGRGDPSP
jgi:hydrogenase nickel incorporation protein HypB